MIVPGSANPLLLASAAVAGGYQISRSLRFNSSDSAFLSRTPASAGNRKTWTWSAWFKKGKLGSFQTLFGRTGNTDATCLYILLDGDNKIRVSGFNPGAFYLISSSAYRDTSAWYHITVAIDTTESSAANRAKVWINGAQLTAFDTDNRSAITQNGDLPVNEAVLHEIGNLAVASFYGDFYLADVHFIDGQALDPTSFGEFDTNGVWQPIAYAGSYGTNGFRLPFSDNSTAAALGTDTSGNGNTWTVNNLSVTAGAGNDSLVDSPTNYGTDTGGAGGEVRGNYCTWNPLAVTPSYQASSLSNGNLDAYVTGNSRNAYSTIAFPTSGKYFFEVTLDGSFSGAPIVGVSAFTGVSNAYPSYVTSPSVVYNWDGTKTVNGSTTSYGATFGAGAVIGVAVDVDSSTVTFYKNGSSQGSISLSVAGAMPHVGSAGATGTYSLNAGQRPFAYTAPSGFKALCTTNLPAPVVAKPNSVFDVKLYTGNGSTQTISGLGFSPDLVWSKARSAGFGHGLFDSVRGVSKYIASESTSAESDLSPNGLTAFNSDGWTESAVGGYNNNGTTYVAWCWDAGSSTVTNTQGSITSQVRANASAGFSIVSYNGTGANGTVGHGLGVAPSFIIVKSRSAGSTDWRVFSSSLSDNSKWLALNTTEAATSQSGYWNTGVSSTVFGLGNYSFINGSGTTFVAYCFAAVAGYSSFGSYTGNGSADGPFVYTGFRPRFILVKNTAGTNNWQIFDTARNEFNVINRYLQPNSSAAESTSNVLDTLSNGFKIRDTLSNWNGSSNTIIYAAFAENPFQYARAR